MEQSAKRVKVGRIALQLLRGGNLAARKNGMSPLDMPAGHYTALCESARLTAKFSSLVCELEFRVVEGQFFGVRLPGWFLLRCMDPRLCYLTQCAIALGREIALGERINPEAAFVGKVFVVEARFRAAKHDGTPADPTRSKGSGDFLRIGRLIRRVSNRPAMISDAFGRRNP